MFREAYRPYCWETPEIDDYKFAPFHLLATEGKVHMDQTHTWHMAFADRLAKADQNLFQPTRTLPVDLEDPSSVEAATRWWEEFTSSGGEGMVVRPEHFLVKGSRGPIQAAIKCRGKEYLRIIYVHITITLSGKNAASIASTPSSPLMSPHVKPEPSFVKSMNLGRRSLLGNHQLLLLAIDLAAL
ncbi:MAG: hypothetical protein ACJAQT_004042 [Akkermansiaceae bacterium]